MPKSKEIKPKLKPKPKSKTKFVRNLDKMIKAKTMYPDLRDKGN